MEKLIKGNKVAVLYAPGWGAGWSTWNEIDGFPNLECIFDPDIAQAVLDKKTNLEIEEMAHAKWGDVFYAGSAKDLMVKWLKIGTEFRITDYDGWEEVEVKDKINWITA